MTKFDWGKIIAHHKDGLSKKQIALKVESSWCAIKTTLKKYKETGDTKPPKRIGRRNVTSSREDRSIILLRNRRKTSSELTEDHNETRNSKYLPELQKEIVEHRFKGCYARKKSNISDANKKRHLEWAKDNLNWTSEQ